MSDESAASQLEGKLGHEERALVLDLALKEFELKAKQDELRNRSRLLGRVNITASQATLIVGVLTFLGSFLGVYVQQGNQLALKVREFKAQSELKQREIEGQLIVSATKDQGAQQALNRLRFLIDAGFIRDADGKISTLILSGKYGGGIGLPSPVSALNALASGEPPSIIQEIIAISGKKIEVDFQKQADFSPIAAVVRQGDGRAALLYDSKQIEKVERDRKNNWTVVAILAHEVGHIVLGHLDLDLSVRCFQPGPKPLNCISHTELELAADGYAGFVLRRLGASLEEAEHSLAFLPAEPSPLGGYPGRKQRTEALTGGWNGPNPVR